MAPPRLTELLVNNRRYRVDLDGDRSLLSVLRDDLHLTGTKYGCGERQCGACVVLLDGHPAPACVTPVSAAQGVPVLTIEGLAPEGALHPLQQAFLDAGALQCGYCTSGMIMAGVALLATNPDPDEETIIRVMDRHICRCGTYPRIVRAIRRAAARMQVQKTGRDVL
jgi:aerobic-type carbon monoxide dehydrogenase small subunit (CoxS/CutS family)